MPVWIATGIRTGVMEAVGGVVRRVDGKQIVMWLRPALDASGTRINIEPRLPFVAGGAALATATAAAGAAITVVAFGLLLRQISQVEARLDQALGKLDAIKADTKWLKRQVLLDHRASLGTALFTAETLEAMGDFDGLIGPIGKFHTAQSFYRQQMEETLADDCPLALASAFVEFANLYVLATGAKARALTLLQGEDEAERKISLDAAVYAGLRSRFVAPLDDPEANLAQLVLLTDEAEAAMIESLPLLPMAQLAEYMLLPGLRRDPGVLAEMLLVSVAGAGERTGAVVVNAMAPPGWLDGLLAGR